MLSQIRTILSVTIIVALLLSNALSSGEQPAAAADGEELDLPPIELPEKGNPKLDSQLNQLVSAQTSKRAASFAQESNIELVEGNVRVIVECSPDQVDAAAKASGALGVVETSYRNLLQVVVPISSLTALADTPGIRLVRLPWYPLPEVVPASLVKPDAVTQTRVSKNYGKLPLSFEANRGQTDPQVNFLSRGSGYTLFLTLNEAVLTLSKPAAPRTADAEDIQATEYAVLRMHFIEANPEPEVTGLEELPGKSNYFIGNDPQQWHTNVPQYAKVRYQDVYPGVHLVYYGNQRQLEYDFVVAPGADPEAIQLGFHGADKLTVDDQGNLILYIAGGEVVLNAPAIYQQVNGVKQAIPGGYVLHSDTWVSFHVGAYDTHKPLIIDPVLSYSTYLTGSGQDDGQAIVVDGNGNAYVTGSAASADFPTQNPMQATFGGVRDAFVAKLNAAGSGLLYSTYLGGSGQDNGFSIAVDASGNTTIAGETWSSDFPTANPLQAAYGGSRDAFVAKLNAAGSSLVYSTYLGGSNFESVGGIAMDSSSNTYVTGSTWSTDFPTQSPVQAANAGGTDVFMAKLNAADSAFVYSTYIGGSDDEYGRAIALDTSGNAYVTGTTESADFPTANPSQAAKAGYDDAFVVKLNAAGSALVYSTYLGGSYTQPGEYGFSIAVDTSGNVYVTGGTESTDFPTVNPFQGTKGGGYDAFVTKLNATGSALVYSTYLGGSGSDQGKGLFVDTIGNAYLTGITKSTDFPTANAFQATFGGNADVFVSMLNAAGSSLVYSTYLGATAHEQGFGITVDASGDAYVTGETWGSNFPTTTGAFQTTGAMGAFVAKIVPSVQFSAATYSVSENASGTTITIRSDGIAGEITVDFATSDGTATAGSDYTATSGTITFADGDTADKTFTIPIIDDALVEGEETVNLTLSNPTGNAVLGSPKTAVLTIIDNEGVTSEGVEVINADEWQTAGYTGAGVKIAILDGGFTGYSSLVGTELPASVTTQSFYAGSDIEGYTAHGTACAEIVYDIAPGAQFYLVNFGNEVEMGNAVDWLIAQGVDVISYSIGWPVGGPGDGTGLICEMVDAAHAAGILWSQSIGNSAQRHWQGDFVDTEPDGWHEFDGGDEGNTITASAGSLISIDLKWDDPWGSSGNDYDLLLFDNTGTLVAYSAWTQDGDDYPVEWLDYMATYTGFYGIAIARYSATETVNFHLYSYYHDLQWQVASSSFSIPADSPNAMAVGAVPWDNPTTLESFSSRGPTKDGEIKPDLVAPDGVSTATYGATAFYGTSASAPYAAGAAALVKERYPSYTPDKIQTFLEDRAVDLGDGGKDNLFGSGRINLPALPDITVSPLSIDFGSVVVGSSSSAQTVTITNDGDAALTVSTITISGTDAAEFSIQNDNASGETLAPSASATLQVVFSPTSTGSKSATLSIPSNDPNEATVNVTLSGTGTMPNITVSPSSINFGSVVVGSSSSAQTITVTNDGDADLTVSTIIIGGTDAAEFSIQNDNASGQTLVPGASATLQVVFSPTATGSKSATLSIPSNDPDEGTVNVALSGTGTEVAPPAVGAEVYPPNKLGILAPWLGLALILALAIGWRILSLKRGQAH